VRELTKVLEVEILSRVRRSGEEGRFEEVVEQIVTGQLDPYAAAEQLLG
jgi:hypothetical protein